MVYKRAAPVKVNHQSELQNNSRLSNNNSPFRATSTGPTRSVYSNQNQIRNSIPKNSVKVAEDFSLPDDCFFINEKREDLPFDPVELSKLKLIKQKAIKNSIHLIQL